MKFILAAALLVGVALSNSVAYYAWRPNQEFIYRYESQVLTGIPDLRGQYAGLKLASDVIVQTFRDYSLRIKFVDPKFVIVNEELKVRNGRPQVPNPEKEVPESLRRFLTEPFEVHLKRGVVESLFVSRDEPVAVTNIKKSLLSQLQLDVTASRKNEILSELPKDLLDQLAGSDEVNESYFATEETTLTGDCATEYNIHRLPKYQAIEIENAIKSSQKELTQLGAIAGEKSEGSEICRGKKYFEINKTKNLDNCRQRPVYQSTIGFKAKCDFSESHCDDALTQIVTTRYVVCGESMEDFIIREAETNNDVVTNPIGYQVTEERMTLAARVNLILLRLKESGFEPLSKPQNAQEKKSLIFQFPKGNRMSTEGSKGLAPGEAVKYGDFVPMLPMPDLTSGEDVLPSPMPFDELKEKIVRQLREVAQKIYESTESCPSKDDVAGKVSSIAYYLRPLSLKQLKEIESEVFRSLTDDVKQIVSDLIVDILSMTGSNPCVMLLKEKIQGGRLGSVKEIKVIQEIARNVRTPTVELLKELFSLTKSLKAKSKSIYFNTAVTQLANLVQNACVSPTTRVTMFPARVYGVFCTGKTEFVTREFIPWLAEELKGARNESERLVIISVLGKLGHPEVLRPLGRVIEGELTKSPLARSVAVYSLKRLAKIQPEMVKPVLLRIIDNLAEDTEVRVAAVSVLPWARPSTAELQKIAVRSWFEPSKQVASFIYTTLKSLTKTDVPELEPVGRQAKNVIAMVKPFQWGIQFSHNTHTQALVKYLRIAHSVETSFVSTAETLFPSRLAFSSRMYGGSWQINGLTFNMYTKGMDSFIDKALVNLGYHGSASSEVKTQLDQIAEKLNISKRNKDKPEMLVQFGMMGMDRVYALDQRLYDDIVEQVTQNINKLAEETTKEFDWHLNVTLAQKSIDIEVMGPCEAGLAVLVKRNVPNVVGIKASIKGEIKSGLVKNFKADIVPVINSKLQADMGVLFPFTKQFIGSGVEQSMHVALPVKVKAEFRGLSELNAVWSTPNEVHNKFELAHYFMKPYTVIKSTQEVIPISKSSDAKIIKTSQPMKEWSFPVAKKIGLESNFKFETDNHKLNFPYIWSLVSQNDLFSLLSFGTTLPSVKYTSWKLDFDPQASAAKSVESTFMLIHGKRSQEGNVEMSFPNEEQVGKHQEQKIQRLCREKHQKFENVENCVEEKTEQLESRRQGHKNARNILEKLSRGSFASGVQIETAIHSGYGRHAIVTRAVLGTETEGKNINSHLDLQLVTPAQDEYFIKAKSSVELPNILYRWDIHSLLDEDIKLQSKLNVVYGKQGGSTEEVKLDMQFRKSEELKESVRRSPEMKRCREEVSQDRELSSVCIEARHQAGSIDHLKAKIEVPASWRRSAVMVKLLAAGENLFFPTTTIIYNDRRQQEDKIEFGASIHFNRSGDVFQAAIESPGRTFLLKNVTIPRPLQKLFPMSVRNNITFRLLQDLTRDQAPASCRLEERIISTFDNKTYAYEMNDCEHLLFKDCSNYQLNRPIAVLARATSPRSNKKIVKILSGHFIVELKPTAPREIGGSVSVTINGREEHVGVSETLIKRSNNGAIVLAVHRFKDGVVSVQDPVDGFEVLFDSRKIEIVGPQVMHNRVCGLCGDLNLENTVDLKSPQQCVMSKPRFAGYSYMIKDGNCDARIPEEDKQRFEEDKRQCTKTRSIPTPVMRLAQKLSAQQNMRADKSLGHMIEKRFNEICFSKYRLRLCHERDEIPAKVQRKAISFVCMPKSNGIVMGLLHKALAGDDISPYLENQRIQYSKTVSEPESCKLAQ